MNECTLVFPVDTINKTVILGKKKRGFGKDKWNGFGGHINPGEIILDCAARELKEECEISSKRLIPVGVLTFVFFDKPDPGYLSNTDNHLVYVFLCPWWGGVPIETEEMLPNSFTLPILPFNEMWEDDRLWLLPALSGFYVTGTFTFYESRLKNSFICANPIKV